ATAERTKEFLMLNRQLELLQQVQVQFAKPTYLCNSKIAILFQGLEEYMFQGIQSFKAMIMAKKFLVVMKLFIDQKLKDLRLDNHAHTAKSFNYPKRNMNGKKQLQCVFFIFFIDLTLKTVFLKCYNYNTIPSFKIDICIFFISNNCKK
ncbi:hypothetical protein RFI_34420, partial [Reticulomyxa filosa]